MSVIIRLQNLPWSANAADIRGYFQGLSIPEGGVHIVGGEEGDAFIAFSTDEDARQAMLLNGGKLKEVQIRLLLSSRTEMLRVIDQARQQAIKLQTLMSVPPAPQPIVPPQVQQAPMMNNVEMKKADPVVTIDDSKPKDNEPSSSSVTNRRDSKEDRSLSRDVDRKRNGRDKDRRGRSKDRSSSRNRSRDRSRDRRDRRRWRDRSRDRSRDRHRRRSRSYERKRSSRDDKDKYGRNKDCRENEKRSANDDQKPIETGAIKVWDNTPPILQAQGAATKTSSLELQNQAAAKLQNSSGPAIPGLGSSSQKVPNPPAIPQMLLQFQQNGKEPAVNSEMAQGGFQPGGFQNAMLAGPAQAMAPMNIPMEPRRENWPAMGGIPMAPMMNPGTMAMPRAGAPMLGAPSADMMMNFGPGGFPQMAGAGGPSGFQPSMFPGHAGFPGVPPEMWRMNAPMGGMPAPMEMQMQMAMQPTSTQTATVPGQQQPEQDPAVCVELRGLPSSANYMDIKKFFDVPIPQTGIKMINDTQGNKTGMAYVRFLTPEHMRDALRKNGQQIRRSSIEVLELRNSIFEKAIDNYRPSDKQRREEELKDKEVKDVSKSRDILDPRLSRSSQPSYSTDSMNKTNLANVSVKTNTVVIKRASKCSERDIHDFFSETGVAPVNINFLTDERGIHNGSIECVFESVDEADKAIAKNHSYLGRSKVLVEKVTRESSSSISGASAPYPGSWVPKTQKNESENRSDRSERDNGDPRGRRSRRRVSRFDQPNEDDKKNEGAVDQYQEPEQRVTPPIRDPRRPPLLKDPSTENGPNGTHHMDQQNMMDGPPNRVPFDGSSMMDGPPMGQRMMNQPMDGHPMMNRRQVNGPNAMMDPGFPNHMMGGDNRYKGRRMDGEMPGFQGRIDNRDRRGGPPNFDWNCENRDRRRPGFDDGRPPRRNDPRGPPPRPNPIMNMRPGSPYMDNETVDGFGRPGCVVAMENVNFKADIDDILQFFSGFDINTEDVIRRFDDKGRPTGDARVAFKSPEDARNALESRNFQMMRGRTVKLYFV